MRNIGYRLFRASFRDRKGRARESAKWYVEFRDHRATVRRLPAFTSKAASDEMGRNLVKLVAYFRSTGGQTDPALQQWLTTLLPQTHRKLVGIGLIPAERVAACKPLTDHLADWTTALRARGNSPDYVSLVTGRVRRIIDGCKFQFPADIAPARVQSYLHGLRQGTKEKAGMAAQTFNFHLVAIKSFCRWMVKDRRASENPVAHLDGLNIKTDRRHDRRALSADELRRFLDTTTAGPERYGMTGPERAQLYRLALETGLRQNELRSLTRASFMLTASEPSVTVRAAYSKRRREDVLPLRRELADELRAFLSMHTPDAPAFRLPNRFDAGRMFRRDVEAAGIAYRDADRRVFDFHGLRHTFISNLARGGVHPKTAQALARHSTITLTMDRYSHTVREDLSDALDALPDLTRPPAESVQATGTDGAAFPSRRMPCKGAIPSTAETSIGSVLGTGAKQADLAHVGERVLASCLLSAWRPDGTSGDSVGQEDELEGIKRVGEKVRENTRKCAHSPANQAEGVGFEPTVGTSPTPVFKTVADSPQVHTPQSDSTKPDAVLASCLALLRPTFPDLAELAARWPALQEVVRAGIVAMVKEGLTIAPV